MVAAGSATQLGSGRVPARYDLAVSTRRCDALIAHEAADLTVTVAAGMTLAALNRQLAVAGQHLPLDPPRTGEATIGAIVATDACGPQRYSHGKVRDLLIGIRVVLAGGVVIKGGGQVVKNVAGYDLMKLFTGSHGTLGMIAEASFKLRPLPRRRATVVIASSSLTDAVTTCLRVRDLAVEPASLQALDPVSAARVQIDRAAAIVQFAGSEVEVAAQIDELARAGVRGEVIEAPADLDEQLGGLVCAAPGEWSARVSLLPSQLAAALAQVVDSRIAVIAYPGNGVAQLRWSGADGAAAARTAEQLRCVAREHGGHCVLVAMPAEWQERIDPWGTLPAAALQRRIKATLDPNDTFRSF